LALLMSDERERDAAASKNHTPKQNGSPANQQSSSPHFAERRRAVLHQMPPHLLEQQQKEHQALIQQQQQHQQTGHGEYGYAYNNHIPWQKIHPSSTKPTVDSTNDSGDGGQNHRLSSSPGATANILSSTPPSGAFLAATAFENGGVPSSSMISHSPARWIPPRSTATPPFQTRMAGFDHEASAAVQQQQQPMAQPYKAQIGHGMVYDDVLPPLTSLDLLHSSPFQINQQGSLLSSLSVGGGGIASLMTHHSGGGLDLRRSIWGSGGGTSGMPNSFLAAQADDDFEDMPFAVDFGEPASVGTAAVPTIAGANTTSIADPSATAPSSVLGASTSASAVASFAQKLKIAPSNRLKLFESQASIAAATAGMQASSNNNNNNKIEASATTEQVGEHQMQQMDLLVSSLADQLAEFRSFGASLQLEPTEEGTSNQQRVKHVSSGASASSTSTPITLRT